jgi:hypothetical protein
LRSPLRYFEWFAEIYPYPLDLAILQLHCLAGIHPLAVVLSDQLGNTELSTKLKAIVDDVRPG